MNPVLRYSTAVLLLALPVTLEAQHISLKTVPIPLGEQFSIFPSRNLGMGSVRVAHDDAQLDPFTNPARISMAPDLRVFALPTFYGEANSMLGGRTFPIAVVVPGKRIFGSAAFAMQQVDTPRRFRWGPPIVEDGSVFGEEGGSNVYVQGSVGARLSKRTALGASVYHADLDGVDAVNLLYGNSIAIDQSGSVGDVRVGLLHDFGAERRLDAVVLRSSVDMRHDVLYQDWTWTPTGPTDVRTWTELNEDRTITWGAHLRYRQPLNTTGAYLGLIATGSTKAHPKIPNYNIVNIPRDPGNSTAFNFGVGLSNITSDGEFSMELVYEPGRSHTWAYADTAIAAPAGTIQPGGKTVDNQFRYGNWNLAVGVAREGERGGFQLGLRMHQTRFSLDQHNYLTSTRRRTDERWLEWAPSWGGVLKFKGFDLRYTGRATMKGWPSVTFLGGRAEMAVSAPDIDYVVGPTGPVQLQEYRVTMHRFMVSVPFGR